MDLFRTLKERKSCRDFLTDSIDIKDIEKILAAASWAPSPLNLQPWQFIVITNREVKGKIFEEAERSRLWALEKSGWKWLDGYRMDFLKSVPVIIAVTGDPKKTGVDMFMEDGHTGYQHACAAAIQNMLLAAHALGISSFWFAFFHKKAVKEILEIEEEKTLIALVCLGRPAAEPASVPRKDVKDKTTFIP
jgi:5,6-dimethylbenzimidazole synthase